MCACNDINKRWKKQYKEYRKYNLRQRGERVKKQGENNTRENKVKTILRQTMIGKMEVKGKYQGKMELRERENGSYNMKGKGT